MSTTPPDADVEALLDRLIDDGAVTEADDGTLATTAAFEDARDVYHDTYAHADDERFRQTVADVFGVEEAEAERRIDEFGVTREELVAYLAAKSFLDDPPGPQELAVMAGLLVEIDPASPVPAAVPELDDDSYRDFLDDHPDAMVTVWKRSCPPCDGLKEDFDEILARVPAGVAAAGVDGPEVPNFRREFEVSAAPSLLFFRDGDLRETLTGRKSPDDIAERLDAVYSTQ